MILYRRPSPNLRGKSRPLEGRHRSAQFNVFKKGLVRENRTLYHKGKYDTQSRGESIEKKKGFKMVSSETTTRRTTHGGSLGQADHLRRLEEVKKSPTPTPKE